ncbi:MAG: Ig-like domain-containing protein [Paludibacter sp.]|nr:Ig-like domain-containing protein [Paludibacter sp.]MBP7613168.1 Ig-like domain-containing protein [Paludibacter sp.]
MKTEIIRKVVFIAVLFYLFFTSCTFAIDCKRMIYVYDIAVCVPNSSPELFMASDGCVQQLLLNSKATNEFFSLEFQPMRILQSATEQVLIGPSQGPYSATDYMIWGELKQTETGRYSITVYLVTANTRRLVAKGTSVFEKPEEAKFAGMTAALSIGAGNSSRPMIDIITDFEKKIRKEDQRKAICPELVYLSKEKSIKAEAGKEILVMFQVKDADDKPVEDATVYVRTEEGTFDVEQLKTDQYGMVKFTHKTPDKRIDYNIHYFAETIAPSEKIIRIEKSYIPVKVKKKITDLVGEIEIHSVERTGNPSLDNTKEGKSFSETNTILSLDLTIIPERINYINHNKETFNKALTELSEFSIVSGSTLKNANGEPTSIKSEASRSTYTLCNNKLELSRSETTKGQSNGFDISVSIVFERGIETNNMTITNLVPKYCLLIKPGSNMRGLFQTGKYRTTGNSKGQQRDYPCGKLEPFDEQLDPKYGLDFGIFYSNMKVNNPENGEIIIPMSIPNSKALEAYLLDPKGVYEINVSGVHIKKDNGETETKVNAKLIMMPKE